MGYEKKRKKKQRTLDEQSPEDQTSERDLNDVRKYMSIKQNPERMKKVQALAKVKLRKKQENID